MEAVCLYGSNNMWDISKLSYNYNSHYFLFINEFNIDLLSIPNIKCVYYILEMPLRDVKDQEVYFKAVKDRYYKHIDNFMTCYQNSNNIKYDKINKLEFNTLYNMSHIKLISANIITINEQKQYLHDLDINSRSYIFNSLYYGKVNDLVHIKLDDLNIVESDTIIGVVAMTNITAHTNSVFNNNERLKQTLSGIKQLKQRYPRLKIIFAENSKLDLYQINKIIKVCDKLILLEKDSVSVIKSADKNEGECNGLLKIINLLQNYKFKNFIKFGARYTIRDEYDLDNLDKDIPALKNMYQTYLGSPMSGTVCYSIPYNYINKYITALSNLPINVEASMYNILGKDSFNIEWLNMTGYSATGRYNLI